VPGEPHRDLLERATSALEAIERTSDRQVEAFERQADAFERQAKAFARQEKSFERMMRRFERSENVFIAAISDMDVSIQRNTERIDDMGEAIRADTRAVLSMLDRLGPAPG
jgi:septal ring factor EnvC (AmiA/AmiB activator)